MLERGLNRVTMVIGECSEAGYTYAAVNVFADLKPEALTALI